MEHLDFGQVKIMTTDIEGSALNQLLDLKKTGIFTTPIRVMPDVHAGAGCVIGFTAHMTDRIIPNIVGVDIGCGMLAVYLGTDPVNLIQLDEVIRRYVPSGMNVHAMADGDVYKAFIDSLYCADKLRNKDHIAASMGTLGGGNHFIEIDKDSMGGHYLVIHTGSRNLGKQVADIYQHIAIERMSDVSEAVAEKVAELKAAGRQAEISDAIKEIKARTPKFSRELAYLQGVDLVAYMHDMRICQAFAHLNRETIAHEILLHMYNSGEVHQMMRSVNTFECIHNYIDDTDMIRKGAIAAHFGQKVLIPLNMRDGCILGVGKGNADWNYSAPHGAGRIMSRAAAKAKIKLEDYQDSMRGIYSTTVNQDTIDEAPMAYKPAEEIIDAVGETVKIVDILHPIYNYKAAE